MAIFVIAFALALSVGLLAKLPKLKNHRYRANCLTAIGLKIIANILTNPSGYDPFLAWGSVNNTVQ